MWGVEFLGDLYECTWSWRKKIVWILVGMVEQCEKVLGCKFTTVGVIMQKGILNKWIFMWGLSFWVICANFSWNGLIVWKIFRLQIHNCWCHYEKSYTKKVHFFLGFNLTLEKYFSFLCIQLVTKRVWLSGTQREPL